LYIRYERSNDTHGNEALDLLAQLVHKNIHHVAALAHIHVNQLQDENDSKQSRLGSYHRQDESAPLLPIPVPPRFQPYNLHISVYDLFQKSKQKCVGATV
jgi:hypothetical protein